MNELLRLEDVYMTYTMGSDAIQVLKGVSLTIHEGEFVAIMGASGSGKSTLLHLAGTLERPNREVSYTGRGFQIGPNSEKYKAESAGQVYFRGTPYALMSRGQRHRLRNQQIGFVFQFYHLLPELNVLENVLLPAMVEAPFYKAFLRARPRKAEALALIDSFGLTPRIKHRPAQLSGGERQRVAIARALINQPALLLADEPTGNLDAKTGRQILDVLVRLHKERGQTMLLVTHDPTVAALADRTVHLVEGRIKN